MKVDLNALCSNNFTINKVDSTGTSVGSTKLSIQRERKYFVASEADYAGFNQLVAGLLQKSHSDFGNLQYGGMSKNREITLFSVFDDIWVNGIKLEDAKYIFAFVRENNTVHAKRTHLCFAPYLSYLGYSNQTTISKMLTAIGCKKSGCWFVSDISIENQETVHFSIVIVNSEGSETYENTKERGKAWEKCREKQFARKNNSVQKIYFGTPGTGKSNRILIDLNKVAEERKFRTTFHPDSDYASFVGCYKPTMNGSDISYSFAPQVFVSAYIAAWNNPQYDYYIIIEEINRGNCAQIFGDIFQLLDRDKTGYSKYPIDADGDLQQYLEHNLTCYDGIKNGKLCLPCNLAIYATMNTSDQSLFPMDSAFKRRWVWEYVPIQYEKTFKMGNGEKENRSYEFIIKIGGKEYSWIKFLRQVNQKIYDLTDSEDKQMGNYFVDLPHDETTIDENTFKNKVMFYLWNDICKDERENNKNFYRTKDGEFSFNKLFEANGQQLIIGFLATFDGILINDSETKGQGESSGDSVSQKESQESIDK